MDGGPGLSGLVVHTSTSLGLLLPSTFDAISCGRAKGEGETKFKKNNNTKQEKVMCQVREEMHVNVISMDEEVNFICAGLAGDLGEVRCRTICRSRNIILACAKKGFCVHIRLCSNQ